MTDPRRRLGAEGEARAALVLRRAGYRILARNVRSGGVELDVVAERAGTVVFVEVKTRRHPHAAGAEAVDSRKQARLVRGALAFLQGRSRRARRVRFDVMAWRVDARDDWHLDHYEGAFEANAER